MKLKYFRIIIIFIWNLPKMALIFIIRMYRLFISPLYGPVCKYYPSCSEYGLKAVSLHGVCKGTYFTAWRILRCNPWSLGGVDDVPVKNNKQKIYKKKYLTLGEHL